VLPGIEWLMMGNGVRGHCVSNYFFPFHSHFEMIFCKEILNSKSSLEIFI
jgi:hypothetical protein